MYSFKLIKRVSAGVVAQVVERLPSKCEALSSNKKYKKEGFIKKI
jgi:hypothetical protein